MLSGFADPLTAESHLRLLVNRLQAFSWTTDLDLRITSHVGLPFLLRPFGQKRILGCSIGRYFRCSRSDSSPVNQHLDALLGVSSQFELQRQNRTFDMTVQPLRDSANFIIGSIGLAFDATEQRAAEEQTRYQATHDGLTGLANYRAFFDALEHEVLRAERSPSRFALVLFDLDDLKGINDRMGHLAGNHALQRVAAALRINCRASDLAARFGGDEFALLLLDSDGSSAEHMAKRVAASLREVPPHPPLGISMGIASFPSDADNSQTLFELADQRLYHHKRRARQSPVELIFSSQTHLA